MKRFFCLFLCILFLSSCTSVFEPTGAGEHMYTQEDIPKMNEGYFGREYYLKVIGYELDRPVVTMALTLTQLESEDSYDGKSSAYFSLEITSVAYSDRYQMMLES